MSFSVEERKSLAAEWCLRAKGKMDYVIVHVGCLSLKDSMELAQHAVKVGADGIAVVSPSFFKPKTADALRLYLQKVASAAPTLPFYYYHIPTVTGVNCESFSFGPLLHGYWPDTSKCPPDCRDVDMLASDVCKGIKKLIPSFSGVKFTGTDLMDFGLCVKYSQAEQLLLYGIDEQLLTSLVLGANGAVGSLYNYLGRHYNKLLVAFAEGDLDSARACQFNVQDFLAFASQYGFDVALNKQLMSNLSGLNLGPPRLPVIPCPPATVATIAEKCRQIFLQN
ncbi:N-acetylneuraminate lyase [Merluccius polli]|uniref:N-acetylneuraminate lyase n=1 Tax=Merluccius polli TaxID=89951 RepID=A0AA47N1W9_MERPO|nr:N-acetylneuraminate lyase [Merluccius polli]